MTVNVLCTVWAGTPSSQTPHCSACCCLGICPSFYSGLFAFLFARDCKLDKDDLFASLDHSVTSGLAVAWTIWGNCSVTPRLTFTSSSLQTGWRMFSQLVCFSSSCRAIGCWHVSWAPRNGAICDLSAALPLNKMCAVVPPVPQSFSVMPQLCKFSWVGSVSWTFHSSTGLNRQPSTTHHWLSDLESIWQNIPLQPQGVEVWLCVSSSDNV